MLYASRSILAICTSAALVTISTHARAQGSLREQTSVLASGAPRQIISINPFMPLAGYFQGEYERKVEDNVSVAVSGSLARFDNRRYQNVDVKLRLYPQDRALEGLGLAAGVGVGRAQQNERSLPCEPVVNCTPTPVTGDYDTAPTFSVEAQYQWLFGRSRATAVTAGGGVKRYFFGSGEGRNIQDFAPTGRLTIGWAFR